MRKMNAMLLVLVMALSLILVACSGNNTEEVSGNAAYSVKVVDAQGVPYTMGVIVKFMKDGTQIAMQPVDANGVATKELEKGNYTVELVFTGDNDGYYDPAAAVLSADKASIQLQLTNKVGSETTTLYVGDEMYTAYHLGAGSTHVPVKAGVRNYFLFTPEEEGTYKFSVDHAQLALGYYGAPHFVWETSAIEVVDNTFSISIGKSSLGGAVYVIGIDGVDADAACVLSILRTGAPEHNVEDEPWTEYKTTAVLKPQTIENAKDQTLVYMDITAETAKHSFVFNETDGYYHLDTKDGPVVCVHLAKGAPYVALQSVIQGDGAMGGAPIRKYFYDDNGKFVKKEDYTDILTNYFENMEPTLGIYPLTDDLIYIIQNGCGNWWDSESPDFIFQDCNPELAWMFACCWLD